jgi:pre-mRNA-processing factor 40
MFLSKGIEHFVFFTFFTLRMTDEWKEAKDASGRTYYYNSRTKQTRWDKPMVIQSLAQKALDDSPWKEFTDPNSDRKYYFNTETKETTWVMPEEYKILQDRVTAEIQANLINETPKEFASVGLQYRTKQEAEDAFWEVLEDIGVQSWWNWEMVVRRAYTHQLYRALKTTNDRKATFEKYILQLSEKEQAAKARRLKRDEEILLKLFSKHGEITGTTPFQKIQEMFEGTVEYDSTEFVNRRIVFQKFREDLRNNEKEMERELRKANVAKFKDILRSLNVSPATTWKECQELVQPYFGRDEDLKKMEKMDMLIAFEDFIITMDSQWRQTRTARLKGERRKERLHRDRFRDLLFELKREKKLSLTSKWKHVYPFLKDDVRYLDMLGNPGSNPLLLFWDTIMSLDDEYRPARRYIFDVVKNSNFEFQLETQLEKFADYFKHEFRKLDPDHVKLAYDEFIYKLKQRNREEKRHLERKLQKKMDDFKEYLKHLEPQIQVSESWEEVKGRLRGLEIEELDEDLRIKCFEKVKRRLQVHFADAGETRRN